MLKKVVAVNGLADRKVRIIKGRITAREIRITIQRQLMFLIALGDLDQDELRSVGLNLHIYRTTNKRGKIVDIRGTDRLHAEGDADRITNYLRRSLRRESIDTTYYFTENVIERLDDFEALKSLVKKCFSKYRHMDCVKELLAVLDESEDMVATEEKESLPQGIISLEYISSVINKLQRYNRESQGERDGNLTQLRRKIQRLRAKMTSESTPHYMNYPHIGERGFKEKIQMFGRKNVGYYLRVATKIPRSDEIMIISVNPWRGACNAFREGEREETISLLKVLVSAVAREWKFNRLKLENVPVRDIENFNEDDLLRITLGMLHKNLREMNLDGIDEDVVGKIGKILAWGPVWTIEELMIVVAMIHREAPQAGDFVKLLKSKKFREAGVKVYGDTEEGYYIYLGGMGETRRDKGIIRAGSRKEHIELEDYLWFLKNREQERQLG